MMSFVAQCDFRTGILSTITKQQSSRLLTLELYNILKLEICDTIQRKEEILMNDELSSEKEQTSSNMSFSSNTKR